MLRTTVGRGIAAVLASALLIGGLATLGAPQSANAAAATSGWLHTSGAAIKTASNATYVVKAAAWFGMETSNCAPHGLWTISLDSGLAQIKSMGFNTIRLAFSNECLAAKTTNSINYSVNPTLAGKSPLQVMDAVIARAKAVGLSVILDRHRPDSSAQSELWYTSTYSEARWIADWKMLATRYKSEPTVVGFDLHNEPHGQACWGCGTKSIDWQAAATRAGNAVLAANPKLLIIVEGVEKQSDTSYTWWGGGLAGVAKKPVVLTVANRVVYSPHDYPSSIYAQTWFSAANYPKNLPAVWDANWGYIARKGIAPVLLGEFGTKLETTSDKQWLATMVSYLKSTGISFAYWSFNPNSGDTGGLVKDDWVTPQTAKLTALKPLLGAGTVVTPVPAPTATPKPTATPTPTATATPKPTVSPSPTSTPKPTTTTSPTPAGAAVAATWMLQSSWNAGYVSEFVVASTPGAKSWTVSWPDTGVTQVVNAWGMTCTVKVTTSITCRGSDWAAAVPAGGSVRVGLQVASSAAPTSPRVTVTAG